MKGGFVVKNSHFTTKVTKKLRGFFVGILVVYIIFGFSCRRDPGKDKQAPDTSDKAKGTALAKESGEGSGGEKQVAKTEDETKNAAIAKNSKEKSGQADPGRGMPPIPPRAPLSSPASMTLLYSTGVFGELESCG